MNVERLAHLAAALEADAANPEGVKFSLHGWLAPSGERKLFHSPAELPAPETFKISCGTQACAMGLACLLPEFQAQGLGFKPEQYADYWLMTPVFEGDTGFAAAARFFDITPELARHLFHPAYYKGYTKGAEAELLVAAGIRKLIAKQSEN